MRRILVVGLALFGLVRPGAAQTGRVSVGLSLDSGEGRGGVRRPVIHLYDLLADSRWSDALDNSLPIIVTHRLQLWRSREGWIDEFSSAVEWQVFVTKEPLQEEYAVTLILQARPQRPVRFADRDSVAAYLRRPNLVEFGPTRPGRYYYTLTTRVTALSDTDMDQLERFLAGDPDLDVPERGTAVGRGIRRLLLRLAGLPTAVEEARSEEFEFGREEDP